MKVLTGRHTAPVGVALVSFTIFLRTSAPSLYGGDSSELASAAWFLGIPHPPGYPLYVIAGRLFSLIPIGDVALRLNIMSAFWAAVATCFIFLLARELTGTWLAAAGCALVFAFSRTFWTQAVMAEVYSMSTALVAAFLFSLWKLGSRGELRWYLLSSLVLGFALLSHQSSICLVPLFLGVLAAREIREWRHHASPGIVNRLGMSFTFLALGLTPILFLPLRSRLNPPVDWGNPESLGAIIENMTRAGYGPIKQNPFSAELFFSQLGSIGGLIQTSFTVFLVPVGVLGLLYGIRKGRKWPSWSFLLFLLSVGSVFISINPRPDPEHIYQIQAFLLPAFIAFSLWVGEGFSFFQNKLEVLCEKKRAGFGGILAGALIFSFAAIPLVSNFGYADKSGNMIAKRYGEDLLKSVPRNGVLIVEGDNESFLSFYLQKVEGVRKDITIYQRKGYLFEDIYKLRGTPRKLWREKQEKVEHLLAEKTKTPIYFSLSRTGRELEGYKTTQEGLLRKLEPESSDGKPRILRYDLRHFPENPEKEDYITRKMMVAYVDAEARRLDEEGKLDEAYPLYRKAARIGFDFAPARFNLGMTAFRLGDYGTAYGEFLSANSLDANLRGLKGLLSYLSKLASHREKR